MLSQERVLSLIRARVTTPVNVTELLGLLKLPRHERVALRRIVKGLVARGELVETRARRFGLPDHADLVSGRLTTHPDGYGFVATDRAPAAAPDVFVPAAHMGHAMHGDRVLVRIEGRRVGDRVEGRLVRILERANAMVVGRFERDSRGRSFIVPFERRLPGDICVPPGQHGGASPAQMVVVEITRWPSPTRPPEGRVVEVLGDADAPGVDTRIIIRKHGIPDVFSAEAEREAQRLGEHVLAADCRARTDFRGDVVVTIDGEHARDFDDAVSVTRLENGNFWLSVHIADVSHYVAEGSALDTDAFERGTSVYFPERAVHMFPPSLATGLCSLRPHVDRLVQSCLMEVDAQGEVVRREFHDGLMCSAARLTYTEVNAILTEHDPETTARYAELVPLLERMRELFAILNDRRRRRGSIDFDLPESEVLLDAEGLIQDIVAAERNVAHRLIEEFMLLANETVAAYLEAEDVPALYRVHESPDLVKVMEFESFLEPLGYSLSTSAGDVRPMHFQRVVERMRGRPEERPIALLMLRTMQKARYDPTPLGHFGLSTSNYAHFTSPIRRYPDLIVHRALRAARHRAWDADVVASRAEAMVAAGRQVSFLERRANDAERELVQWKKTRFMAKRVGEVFDGYITGVASFGLFVELTTHFVEGLVHTSSMADDFYRYDDRTHTLNGERSSKRYRLGDRVTVQVLSVDLDRRRVELGLVEILEAVRRPKRPSDRGSLAPRSSVAPPRRQRLGKRERAARGVKGKPRR